MKTRKQGGRGHQKRKENAQELLEKFTARARGISNVTKWSQQEAARRRKLGFCPVS